MNNMENLNLVHKIALSFHKTTGVDLNDLFSEACIAYYEGLKRYNPKRGMITTFMWQTITSHLKNYLRKQKRETQLLCLIEDILYDKENILCDSSSADFQLFELLNNEAQQIVNVITNSPEEYDCLKPPEARQHVREIMLSNGWKRKKIRSGIRCLRTAFSN